MLYGEVYVLTAAIAMGLSLSAARAANDPNKETLIVLGLIHQGRDHPWGVELGAERLLALGDHCSWNEWPECRNGAWWPLVGPRVAITWRGGGRLGASVEGLGGVAAVDMHQFGFLPVFGLTAAAGLVFEFDQPPALSLGGTVTKSLSYTRTRPNPGGVGTSSRTYGLDLLSAAFGARARWAGKWLPARWAGSLELATAASDYL